MTADSSQLLDRLVSLLQAHRAAYCVVGGQAVNAYVEPLVSLDLDLAVAAAELDRLMPELESRFLVERFTHSLNLSAADSDLRVQFQLDPRYSEFVHRAQPGTVLGIELPVARLDDVLLGKVWAAMDPATRASKRQKDLADIARILEAYPHLRAEVPADVLARLV